MMERAVSPWFQLLHAKPGLRPGLEFGQCHQPGSATTGRRQTRPV